MRTKSSTQGYLDFTAASSTKIVVAYRQKYAAISQVLEANPRLLTRVHNDLAGTVSLSEGGRRSGYTSEQVLRALVVMFVEGDSYRGVVIRVANSEFLQNFVKLELGSMMGFSFLCKAYSAIAPETWQAMNRALGQYARRAELISAEKVRVDTTAVETTVHYPTDSSLLWDSFRTLARLMKLVQPQMHCQGLTHRFHVKKVKKLAHYISRNAAKRSKREQRGVKKVYGTLIERVRWINAIAQQASLLLQHDVKAMRVAAELAHYTPLVARIAAQAQRRIFEGETVPPQEKVYSLFEEHTELIKRGKAGKPIEFGHKVLFAETEEKFILHYNAYPKQRADKDLVHETLAAHRTLFGQAPGVFAADKGFYENMKQIEMLEKKIDTVAIAKKGRRNAKEHAREHTEDFINGQKFRAGCEGTISVLKRAFKLHRCAFKGFRNYAASIGCAVFCHNLVLLARC